jgi:hypothetical protein
MERDGQLDHAEVGPKMAAGLRKDLNQLIAHLLRKLRETFLWQRFHVDRRMNPA